MPSVSTLLQTLLYSAAAFLPWLVVTYYPFRKQLRLPTLVVALFAAILAAGRVALDLSAATNPEGGSLVSLGILTLAYVICFFLSVKGSLSEMVLVLALTTLLGLGCSALASAVQPDGLGYTLALLVISSLAALLFCPLYRIAKEKLDVLLEKLDAQEGDSASAPEDATSSKLPKDAAADQPAKAEPQHKFRLPWKKQEDQATQPTDVEPVSETPVATPPESIPAPAAPAVAASPAEPVQEEPPAPAEPSAPVAAPVAEPAPVVKPEPDEPSSDAYLEQLRSMQFTSLNARILESRQLRKDLRRQIDTMTECLNTKNYERLQAMLHAMRQQFSTTSYSSNAALSAPLDYYSQLARSRGIPMNIDVQLPENSFTSIDPADLILILGNLLDNALDACKAQHEGPRRIQVAISMGEHSIGLVVKNTCSHAAKCNAQGEYLSDKYEGPGAGLLMVRTIAQRCNGSVSIDTTDTSFTVRVRLNA